MITHAGTKDATLLTELSVTTFCDKFAPLNKPEDMDLYLAAEMNEAKLAAELADTENLFLFAQDGNTVVGYAKLRTKERPEGLDAQNPIELERLYVRQQHQGKRTGSALMDYCLAYATAKQHDTIWLGVWERNDGAIKFYERYGFKIFGAHPFVLGTDHQTDVMMKRSLDGLQKY